MSHPVWKFLFLSDFSTEKKIINFSEFLTFPITPPFEKEIEGLRDGGMGSTGSLADWESLDENINPVSMYFFFFEFSL